MILADECIPPRVCQLLREAGLTVFDAATLVPGATDLELLEAANRSGLIVLTHDRDFGELVVRDRHPARGIVLVRWMTTPAELVAALLPLLCYPGLAERQNASTVISPEGEGYSVRMRPLLPSAALDPRRRNRRR